MLPNTTGAAIVVPLIGNVQRVKKIREISLLALQICPALLRGAGCNAAQYIVPLLLYWRCRTCSPSLILTELVSYLDSTD
jgi:hypothetical protein